MKQRSALVIDDSRAMRMVLGGLLSELGYQVFEAENGAAGVAQLANNADLDVILVDWNMPVMNGLEFITAVRAKEQLNAVRLLVITSETEVGQMINALSAGADEYLMKPFTTDALLRKLEMLGLDMVRS